jgi:DAK2 domain fusion protein YloV
MTKTTKKSESSDSENIEPIYSINGQDLKKAFYAALVWFKNHQQVINSLNVFPVPDGDTGTNMFLTMQSAYNEIAESLELNAGKVAKQIAQGALMGARGNSGVILSQLFRGFARVMDEHQEMNAEIFIKALGESRNTAYKGVVRPVEGTILTVSKDIAEEAGKSEGNTSDILQILEKVVKASKDSVENTPELLPILKQAGVVDSGGKGLSVIYEGMYRFATKQSLDISEVEAVQAPIDMSSIKMDELHGEIEEGQDFEIVVDFIPTREIILNELYTDLSEIGTSIQVGEGDEMYRMHIHVPTENKYKPIDLISEYGTVRKVYIENLIEQMQELESSVDFSNPVEEGQIAVVAISPGTGISKIFKSLGVAKVVSGGQTMNPSTQDILQSFENLPTNKVIILPNNKNILMASEAAKNVSVKDVSVIPTKNIPQGMVACLRLNPAGDFNEIVEEMNESLEEVESGEITTATRSIEINGIKVKKGEAIALLNGELVSSSKSLMKACQELLEKANTEEREHITIFQGENATQSMVDDLVELIEKKYPDHEIEIHVGGQPHYQFILSIE